MSGDWLTAAITGATSLITTAVTANQIKQQAKGQANNINAQNLNNWLVAQEQTKQAQLAYQAALASTSSPAARTGIYIALGVVGVAVFGVVIYAITRPRATS